MELALLDSILRPTKARVGCLGVLLFHLVADDAIRGGQPHVITRPDLLVEEAIWAQVIPGPCVGDPDHSSLASIPKRCERSCTPRALSFFSPLLIAVTCFMLYWSIHALLTLITPIAILVLVLNKLLRTLIFVSAFGPAGPLGSINPRGAGA